MNTDPYLILTDNVKPPIGLNAIDFLKGSPGRSLTRTFELLTDHDEATHLPKYNNHFLCHGAACGLDHENKIVHFYSDQGLRFAGFLTGQSGDGTEAALKTRGSVLLHVPGATPEDVGRDVFCSGPDAFSLSRKGDKIGKIRHVNEHGMCLVFFKQTDDPRPEYLGTNIR